MNDTSITLDDTVEAEIDNLGHVTLLEESGHVLTLTPEAAYTLLTWLYTHQSTLYAFSHEGHPHA